MPPPAQRAPAPEEPFWPHKGKPPAGADLRERGVKLHLLCGRPGKELIYAESGYGAAAQKGYAWSGWALPVYHALAGDDEAAILLTVPKGAAGLVRVFVIDPDNFEGGRREKLSIAGQEFGPITGFQDGKWIECPIGADKTAEGKVPIRAANLRKGSNAVISIVEWIEK